MDKRVPDEFGLIYPENSGFTWVKQGGGMTPQQRKIEGVYIPIGRLNHNLGFPEWSPEGPGFEEKLEYIDLADTLSEEEYLTLPERVKSRGHFESSEEYMNWIESTEIYGHVELWEDLRRFTYGIFDLLDSDPRNRWQSVDELWSTIDEYFSFDYRRVDYSEYSEYGLGDYPRPEPAIRPILITEAEETYTTDWTELEGEVVFLTCPNAD